MHSYEFRFRHLLKRMVLLDILPMRSSITKPLRQLNSSNFRISTWPIWRAVQICWLLFLLTRRLCSNIWNVSVVFRLFFISRDTATISADRCENAARLCAIILTCISEVNSWFFLCQFLQLTISFQDQYANTLMHDVNMTFKVPIFRAVWSLLLEHEEYLTKSSF